MTKWDEGDASCKGRNAAGPHNCLSSSSSSSSAAAAGHSNGLQIHFLKVSYQGLLSMFVVSVCYSHSLPWRTESEQDEGVHQWQVYVLYLWQERERPVQVTCEDDQLVSRRTNASMTANGLTALALTTNPCQMSLTGFVRHGSMLPSFVTIFSS